MAPDGPTKVLAKEVKMDSMTLEWVAPTNTGGEEIKSYIVEQSEAGGEYKQVSSIIPRSFKRQIVSTHYSYLIKT